MPVSWMWPPDTFSIAIDTQIHLSTLHYHTCRPFEASSRHSKHQAVRNRTADNTNRRDLAKLHEARGANGDERATEGVLELALVRLPRQPAHKDPALLLPFHRRRSIDGFDVGWGGEERLGFGEKRTRQYEEEEVASGNRGAPGRTAREIEFAARTTDHHDLPSCPTSFPAIAVAEPATRITMNAETCACRRPPLSSPVTTPHAKNNPRFAASNRVPPEVVIVGFCGASVTGGLTGPYSGQATLRSSGEEISTTARSSAFVYLTVENHERFMALQKHIEAEFLKTFRKGREDLGRQQMDLQPVRPPARLVRLRQAVRPSSGQIDLTNAMVFVPEQPMPLATVPNSVSAGRAVCYRRLDRLRQAVRPSKMNMAKEQGVQKPKVTIPSPPRMNLDPVWDDNGVMWVQEDAYRTVLYTPDMTGRLSANLAVRPPVAGGQTARQGQLPRAPLKQVYRPKKKEEVVQTACRLEPAAQAVRPGDAEAPGVSSSSSSARDGKTVNRTPVKTQRFWASSRVETLPRYLIAPATVSEAPALTGDVRAAPTMGKLCSSRGGGGVVGSDLDLEGEDRMNLDGRESGRLNYGIIDCHNQPFQLPPKERPLPHVGLGTPHPRPGSGEASERARHLLEQEGGNGEGEAPDSDMDTEDNMPSLPAPPSPMGSEATANNLDDF
nr:unnamed protein product [Digitaria exilis]